MMTLHQAQGWLPSARVVGDGAVRFNRVHTDTRTLQNGDLFVALKGDNFDAHEFLQQAREKGAVAAIAQRGLVESGFSGLEVTDSKRALGELAAAWRAQFKLPLIAVTGSNGKTTLTQMIASILRAWKADGAFATEGNFNNDIGVPLTLLRLRSSHQAAVVELGMNHPGEIAYLASLAKPTVAVVNNAQREHLEFMSTVEAVARENGTALQALDASGTAVFPADDDYANLWREIAGARRTLTFAQTGEADVTATAYWADSCWQVAARTPAGPLEFALRIAGRHNVKNALAATACALAIDVPLASIAQGLSAFEPVKGRSRSLQIRLPQHVLTLIDDTYNSNPDSMKAAIDVLAELPGPRLLVMGDMGEVGDQGPRFHQEAGEQAQASGIETLFTIGAQSVKAHVAFGSGWHFETMDELNAAVLHELPKAASVLIKGSRFMKMERVVQAISGFDQENSQGNAHAA
jgi:UDP-N-acetylmuramoyl-tripeptide--D-alanyl-D-alanine ligase